jgi:nicotinate-nucleotide adenylyltransferase
MTKKIGIFAGVFDPVHRGHLAVARKALVAVDEVVFMPESQPHRKSNVAPIDTRIHAIEQALLQTKHMRVMQSQLASFHVQESLEELHEVFPGAELYFIFGDDVLDHMLSWPHIDILSSHVVFIIATRYKAKDEIRAFFDDAQKRGVAVNYTMIDVNEPISSTMIRAQNA